MQTSTEPSISPTLSSAIAASAQGDSATALALFEQAATEQPASGWPHFMMAGEYASLGQMEKAEAEFAAAVLLAPDFSIARYQLGLLQFSSARAAMALLTWQPLLQLPEDSPFPCFVRGFAALANDRFDEARRWFEAGMERNVDNPPMSSDIRKVIQKIELLQATQDHSASPSPLHEHTDDGLESSHVLLSNYQQQGPAH